MTAGRRHMIATHADAEANTDTDGHHGLLRVMIPVTVVDMLFPALWVMVIRLVLQCRRRQTTCDDGGHVMMNVVIRLIVLRTCRCRCCELVWGSVGVCRGCCCSSVVVMSVISGA